MMRIFIVASVASICSLHSLFAQLVVHEWGTFTTLSGSSGGRLSGLTLEEEFLPGFVYQHDNYHPTNLNKGFGLRDLKNVNVKMETPVIYFYSESRTNVKVRVDFPRGAISQWYPQRTAGETVPPSNKNVDFANKYNGWIEWSATVFGKNEKVNFSAPESEVTKTWQAPREVDANAIQCDIPKTGKSEIEKYLFYRGVGNFELPLATAFQHDGQLALDNLGNADIPYALVFHQRDSLIYNTDGKVERTIKLASVWWAGIIPAGTTIVAHGNQKYSVGAELAMQSEQDGFINALTGAGLYPKEAHAMLNTWFESYFKTDGLRVFWVVPRTFTDELIPLTIEPKPADVQRVLVGRSEILTPEFERELLDSMAEKSSESKWTNDRYLLAYRQRVNQLKSTSSLEREIEGVSIRVFPNPASQLCSIQIASDHATPVQLVLSDVNGRQIVAKNFAEQSMHTYSIDLSKQPAGTYYLNITACGKRVQRLVVKE